jgi:molybdopterin/thiamine biosynthesis adenylyltransferase
MTNNVRQAELEGTIDYTRQRDWFDPSNSDARVTIIGCGGIGSPTALSLAKLGIPELTLIDPDTVEKHNVPNQLFPLDDIGQTKVDALANMVESYSVSGVTPYYARATASGFEAVGGGTAPPGKATGIVVSALDSMEARAELWKQLRYNVQVPLLVDGRLGGENVVIYTVDPRRPDQCRQYEDSLHSDDEAVPAPCTRRSIIDVGFVVASLITRAVRRHLAGEPVERTLFWNHARLNAMHDGGN